jgi:hypothetical protein
MRTNAKDRYQFEVLLYVLGGLAQKPVPDPLLQGGHTD